jgi:hypothetical protein
MKGLALRKLKPGHPFHAPERPIRPSPQLPSPTQLTPGSKKKEQPRGCSGIEARTGLQGPSKKPQQSLACPAPSQPWGGGGLVFLPQLKNGVQVRLGEVRTEPEALFKLWPWYLDPALGGAVAP